MIAADHAAIDKQEDEIFGRAIIFRLHGHAFQDIIQILPMDLNGAFGHAAVIHLHEDLAQAAIASGLKDHLSPMGQRKTDLWIGERKLLHDIADQENSYCGDFRVLKAGRCALKEMFDFDPGASRAGSGMCTLKFCHS